MAASEDNHQPKKRQKLSLPGQPTEEAIAEVGSEAGRSLLRGLGTLGNAALGRWIAKREAQRLATETEGKLEAAAAVAAARREQELADVDHQAALNRRAERLRMEMAREQLNLEAIQTQAIEYTERDSGNATAREIDEDWLFRFTDLAQRVSDRDVQALWARALSSAAMQESPLISAAGLQTLGLFDKEIAENFRRFTAVVARLGFVPRLPDGEAEPQQIDRAMLADLGLVRETMFEGAYEFVDFRFKASEKLGGFPADLNAHMALTLRGLEIAHAVFREENDIPLREDDEQRYLRHVVLLVFQYKSSLTLLPKLPDGSSALATIRLASATNISQVTGGDWKATLITKVISERLRKLLEWAEGRYDIQVIEAEGQLSEG